MNKQLHVGDPIRFANTPPNDRKYWGIVAEIDLDRPKPIQVRINWDDGFEGHNSWWPLYEITPRNAENA